MLELDGEDLSEDIIMENRCFQELETQKSFESEMQTFPLEIYNVNTVANSLIIDFASLDQERKQLVKDLQYNINNSSVGWKRLDLETDVNALAVLLYDWIEHLKYPVLDQDNLETIVIHHNQLEICLSKFDMVSCSLQLLMFFYQIYVIKKKCFEILYLVLIL